eukprot:TRINITY_DN317_c0_g1_i2.p2 TRINITY_DN317_c0_g1~~TRINITY_DN317_c0_g1_i2.p2  ORF type:complete len:75 (+),score=24.67 TRINITY_DN317_c0_g1_i2:79-303(+)
MFVESVLRYGLPASFDSFIIRPNKRNERKLRDVLGSLLNDLSLGAAFTTTAEDVATTMAGGMEFFPYVYLPLNL